MNRLTKLALGSTVTATILLSGVVPAQDNPDTLRSVVVKLRIRREGQADETAAGVYVGRDQQSAYFITAYHAIGPNARGIPVQAVRLQFFASPQNFSAAVFENYDEGLDFGVLSTATANLPQLPTMQIGDPKVVPIRIIGHPAGESWSVWSGSIKNENASVTDIHRFLTSRDDALAEGFSGGPVVDDQGAFLGMHTSTDRKNGFAVKSAEIVSQLKAWRVPTNNFTTAGATTNQQAELDSIKKVVDSYESAYNLRDANALWMVWPNPPAKIKQAIEAYFRNAASIKASLHQVTTEIATDHKLATVRGQFSQRFTPREGNAPPPRDDDLIISLEKNNGAWIIVDVK